MSDETSHPFRLPGALPAFQSSFVGRAGWLDELAHALARPGAAVALVGPPGVGKTRLAAEALGRTEPEAVFVGLRGVRDADDLLEAVRSTVGVAAPAAEEPEARAVALGRRLSEVGPPALVLDAVEGLDGPAVATLARLLGVGGDVRWILTTQRPLELTGVKGRALPALGRDDSMALLVERVRWARGGLGLRGLEQAAADDLLHRLEGVPLAIELAASRLRVLSVPDLVARLDAHRASGALVSGQEASSTVAFKGALGGALRRTIAWAFDLLQPWERDALAQVSVFRGGFDAEAAESVLDTGGRDVLDFLERTVSRSLLSARRLPDGAVRFVPNGEVERFAAAALSPEARREAEARHARYFAHAAGRWSASLHTPEWRDAHARLRRERENLRAAEERLPRSVDAVELLLAQQPGRVSPGAFEEDRRRVERAVALAAEADDPALLVRALLAESDLYFARGRLPGVERALARAEGAATQADETLRATVAIERLRARAVASEDSVLEDAADLRRNLVHRPALLAELEMVSGLVHDLAGRTTEAEAQYQRALSLFERAGNVYAVAALLTNLGNKAMDGGRLEEAGARYRQALALHRELGNARAEGTLLGNQGELWRKRGEPVKARKTLRAAIDLGRYVGNAKTEAFAWWKLGVIARDEGTLDEAESALRQALSSVEDVGAKGLHANVLTDLEAVLRARGRDDEAAVFAQRRVALGRAHVGLEVDGEGRWFRVAGGERVDLGRRRSARLVLRTLAERRLSAPGRGLPLEELFAHGWPGQRVRPSSRAQRVYVLVSTLRELGLHALLTRDDGYLLDPDVDVTIRRG